MRTGCDGSLGWRLVGGALFLILLGGLLGDWLASSVLVLVPGPSEPEMESTLEPKSFLVAGSASWE